MRAQTQVSIVVSSYVKPSSSWWPASLGRRGSTITSFELRRVTTQIFVGEGLLASGRWASFGWEPFGASVC